MSKKKIAVVVFNLGGPDSIEAIRPFLLNFFTDKNIIPLPYPLRRMIAQFIAWKRGKEEALESYKALGGKSPLLENTIKQVELLETYLSGQSEESEFKTFVSMRYWHPMTEEVVKQVEAYAPDQIIILPFYPQFSTTTTWSSLEQWKKFSAKSSIQDVQTSVICCYPKEEGFVKASAAHIREVYNQALSDGHKKVRVLFSAHGLPESIIEGGDPYQAQCEMSVEEIIKELSIEGLDYQNCYQSRVGPKKWIGPSTDEAIEKAAEDDIDALLVYPHAFVNEHVETLVEIEEEYRELAEDKNIKGFYRVSTVSENKDFIEGLGKMVLSRTDDNKVCSNEAKRICPMEFGKCCMQMCGS